MPFQAHTLRRALVGGALALLTTLASASGSDENAAREIDHLLDFVSSSGCTFIRNGKAHDPAQAADHLRMKYRRAHRYVDSAETFIDRIASESSLSGRPYRVSCDGHEETTKMWLQRALADYRQAESGR